MRWLTVAFTASRSPAIQARAFAISAASCGLACAAAPWRSAVIGFSAIGRSKLKWVSSDINVPLIR
ncbi:MAG: hypothetical protein ABIO86_09425, partial [Sphingomonas sp.]